MIAIYTASLALRSGVVDVDSGAAAGDGSPASDGAPVSGSHVDGGLDGLSSRRSDVTESLFIGVSVLLTVAACAVNVLGARRLLLALRRRTKQALASGRWVARSNRVHSWIPSTDMPPTSLLGDADTRDIAETAVDSGSRKPALQDHAPAHACHGSCPDECMGGSGEKQKGQAGLQVRGSLDPGGAGPEEPAGSPQADVVPEAGIQFDSLHITAGTVLPDADEDGTHPEQDAAFPGDDAISMDVDRGSAWERSTNAGGSVASSCAGEGVQVEGTYVEGGWRMPDWMGAARTV